jgi:biopolymer transport protein TolR
MARHTNRRRRRSPSVMQEISLTPLIDMALTLLVIFMVTAPMMNNSIQVDLPQGQVTQEVNARPDLIVSVDKNKKLFFNDEPIANHAILIEKVQKSIDREKDRTVFIRADRGVEWGDVAELAGSMMKEGIRHVAFATTAV